MITENRAKNNIKNILIAITLFSTLVTADTITKSGKGTFITEDFDCKVTLANVAELQRVLGITPRMDFKYSIFLSQYETVSKALSNHTECKGVSNGK